MRDTKIKNYNIKIVFKYNITFYTKTNLITFLLKYFKKFHKFFSKNSIIA